MKMIETPKAETVRIDSEFVYVDLKDGRKMAIPVKWYPRLAAATEEQRQNFYLIGGGIGICWPDVDEDLSIKGFLLGNKDLTRPIIAEIVR
jgi:hypothetical protein